MFKLSLVESLKQETNITKKEAAKIVDIFFDEIAKTLILEDRVKIDGFGSFYIEKKKGRPWKSPKILKKYNLAAFKKPIFRCSKRLLERIDK